MSVVVPAYNEEERLCGMLEEAVSYLQDTYGGAHDGSAAEQAGKEKGVQKGWEILVVSDGSTDKTVDKALEFAKDHQLSQHPVPVPGPWSEPTHATHIPHGSVRVITLEENRGKGGAVTHGMRHVRGQYVVFADADGASRFEDLGKLVEGCKAVEDKFGRGVAIGSRAHLVGSEAVVKVRMSGPYYPSPCLSRTLHLTLIPTALQTPQLPNALVPPPLTHHDPCRHCQNQRYPMWV
jgi:dolichyl-phosphate beta-glucosyltransferase